MESRSFGVELQKLEKAAGQLAVYHQEEIPGDFWHGYLSAVALSPVALPENQWLRSMVHKESSEETAELEEDLRTMLTGVIEALHEQRFTPYFPGNMESWRECRPSQWCEGFLTGSNLWPEDLQRKAGEELIALTLPVVIFLNPDEYFHDHAPYMNEDEREELMDQSFAFLPKGLYEIPGLWDEVLKDVEDEEDEDDDFLHLN
jgi:uncharacterized protein